MPYFFKKKYIITSSIIAAAAIIGYLILPVSVPLICAFLTACLLEPASIALEKKYNLRSKIAKLLVFTFFVLFIAISAYFLTTKVIAEAIGILQKMPHYLNQINSVWLHYDKNLTHASNNVPDPLTTEIRSQAGKTLIKIKEQIGSSINIDKLTALIAKIPNFLIGFLVYLVALFLFLIDLPRLRAKAYKHLKQSTADKFGFMTSRLSYVLFGFMKAQLMVGIIIFTVSLTGMLFINADVAILMSVIIAIVDFIPFVGAIIILGPWSIFHYMTGDFATGTQLAVLGCILLIIRRSVEPKVLGSHIGLSPLNTLVTMYLGFKILGILGIIFGPILLIAFYSAREAGIIKLSIKL